MLESKYLHNWLRMNPVQFRPLGMWVQFLKLKKTTAKTQICIKKDEMHKRGLVRVCLMRKCFLTEGRSVCAKSLLAQAAVQEELPSLLSVYILRVWVM